MFIGRFELRSLIGESDGLVGECTSTLTHSSTRTLTA